MIISKMPINRLLLTRLPLCRKTLRKIAVGKIIQRKMTLSKMPQSGKKKRILKPRPNVIKLYLSLIYKFP